MVSKKRSQRSVDLVVTGHGIVNCPKNPAMVDVRVIYFFLYTATMIISVIVVFR